jgi:hypothetical protein
LVVESCKYSATDAPASQPEPDTVAVEGYAPDVGDTLSIGCTMN